jgi:Gpi18-like mannosyltransferase
MNQNRVFTALCVALTVSAICLRIAGLPFRTHDMQDFLLPWFDAIVTRGHFNALSGDFYNYTPPYMYLMAALSYLDGIVDRVVLIKAISIAFDAVAAFVVYKITVAVTQNGRRAVLAALIFLNLPTVILNGAVWGQCDVIYTSFLLLFAYCLIKGRPVAAMLMFSIALSIKVQAIFLAPFIVFLLLAGLMPAWTVILPPLVYIALILPTALLGRGWVSLLTIYADQAGISNKLSARAPNIYVVIQHFLDPASYGIATIAGVLVAGVVSLAFLAAHFRLRRPMAAVPIIACCALWLALEPSLLPKMHDRYFFAGDIFAFALAVLMPRVWWVAALFQVGSVLAYSYFMGLDYQDVIDLHPAALLGAFAAMPAMLGLAYGWWRLTGNAAPARAMGPSRRVG